VASKSVLSSSWNNASLHWLCCGFDERGITVRFPAGVSDFLSSQHKYRLWGVPSSHLFNGYWALFLGVKRPVCEVTTHFHLVSRLQNTWSYTSTLHAYMECTETLPSPCTIYNFPSLSLSLSFSLLHWLYGPYRTLVSLRINFQVFLSLPTFLHPLNIHFLQIIFDIRYTIMYITFSLCGTVCQ
jgi:hypothetical protein